MDASGQRRMMVSFADVFAPDGDEARQWAEQELSHAQYQAAKPTWFDRLADGILQWIIDLFSNGDAGAVAPVATTVIVIVIVAALVVALLLWGRPRSSHTARRTHDLLGERDDRTAAQLRAGAIARAKARDWDAALVLRYRALARALIERDLIDPAPGDTAQSIARSAAHSFPDSLERLRGAATAFDAVRYLGSTAAESDYLAVAAVDDELQAAVPRLASVETVAPA